MGETPVCELLAGWSRYVYWRLLIGYSLYVIRETYQHANFADFPKLDMKMIHALDHVLMKDIPSLMAKFSAEISSLPQFADDTTDPFHDRMCTFIGYLSVPVIAPRTCGNHMR